MKKIILTLIISVFVAQTVSASCPLGIAGGDRGTRTTITGETSTGTVVDSI